MYFNARRTRAVSMSCLYELVIFQRISKCCFINFIYDWFFKDPNIDIFSILNIRKRLSRSHGVRRNGNIKRKSKITLPVIVLNIILKNSGKHAMLSRLTSFSLSSLKILDAGGR
jgi:hypothetical protein